MALDLFQPGLSAWSAVELPPGIDPDARARLVGKLAAAVRQQAELGRDCDALLGGPGELIDAGARLLIQHEPAQACDPVRALTGADRPNVRWLWWVTERLLSALRTASAAGLLHGGMTLASLVRDETGRLKLSGFGIAGALESALGLDARRRILFDASHASNEGGRLIQGAWRIAEEGAAAEHGWIASYYAPELLPSPALINPRTDQFSAGLLLHALATGGHAYGGDWSDPNLLCYFQLEPAPLGDARPEWADAFSRAEQKLTQNADQALLAWAQLTRRMLASDPSQRWSDLSEPESLARAQNPTAWRGASQAIERARPLLSNGDAQGALELVEPWKSSDELPEDWRATFTAWIEQLESRKEHYARRSAAEKQLREGREALDLADLVAARRIANDVLACLELDSDLRTAADELLSQCDEHERFIQSGADEVSRAYLDAAAEHFEQGETDEARLLAESILKDPATPGRRAAQARELLARIELMEQRLLRLREEFLGARQDLAAARYGCAGQRVEALLRQEQLPPALEELARELSAEISAARERNAACGAALSRAREGWERGDLHEMDAQLALAPPEALDAALADARGDLEQRRTQLNLGLARLTAAMDALARGTAQPALRLIEDTLASVAAPQCIIQQLESLASSARLEIEREREERSRRATEALDRAHEALEQLDPRGCAECLEALHDLTELPEEKLRELEALRERRLVVQAALNRVADVEELARKLDFDAALARMAEIPGDGLPQRLREQLGALARGIESGRAHLEAALDVEIGRQLDEIEATVAAGDIPDAHDALQELAQAPRAKGVMAPRFAELGGRLERDLALYRRLAEIDLQARRPDANIEHSLEALADIPADAPPWARRKAEGIVGFLDALAENRRRETLERGQAALNEARQALAAEDLPSAQRCLATAEPALLLSADLAQAHANLREQVRRWEEWAPRVEAVVAALQTDDPFPALETAASAIRGESVPAALVERLRQAQAACEARIAQRREQIDAKLDQLTRSGLHVGRAMRGARIAQRLAADPLATDEQRQRAEKLARRLAAQPGWLGWSALGAAAMIALVTLGLRGWMNSGGAEPAPSIAAAAPPTETPSATSPLERERASASHHATPAEPPPEVAQAASVDARPAEPPAVAAEDAGERLAEEARDALLERRFSLAVDYDDSIEFDPERIRVSADADANEARVTAFARLKEDPRPGEAFAFAGAYRGGRLHVDEEAAEAFNAYLSRWQQQQIGTLRETLQARLRPGAEVAVEAGPGAGPRVIMTAQVGGHALTEAEATWIPGRLAYEFPADEFAREAERMFLEWASTDRGLISQWDAARDGIGLSPDTPGAVALSSMKLVAVEPQALEDFTQLQVRARAESSEWSTPLVFEAAVIPTPDGWAWAPQSLSGARPVIEEQLAALANDPQVRERRVNEALASLGQGARRTSDINESPLRAETSGASPRTYEARWNAAALRFDAWIDVTPAAVAATPPPASPPVAPAPPSPPTTFAALSGAAPSGDALASALRIATERKAAGSGPEMGLEARLLAGDLAGLSGAWREMFARAGSAAPPSLFIEFILEGGSIYGASWRLVNGAVTDLRAWEALSGADLARFADAGALRRALSEDAQLGERLLGPALGAALTGDERHGMGILIAPVGPLWKVRWEQVQFSPRAVSGIDDNGMRNVASATTLRGLLMPERSRQGADRYRRVSLWTTPAIGARWSGPQAPFEVRSAGAPAMKFRPLGEMFFAPVVDDQLAGDFGFREFERSATPASLGTAFWDRRWSGQRWEPTPFVGYALMR